MILGNTDDVFESDSRIFDGHPQPIDKSIDLSIRGEVKRLDPVTTGVENAVQEKHANRPQTTSDLPKIIFFGNGPLADYSLAVLKEHCDVIFHARTREDLESAAEFKRQNPDAHGVLASFGVLINSDFLELFEPEGILNLHPSKLPAYRGASPIETAILTGNNEFSYSIMKLVKAMDAGPIYHQATLENLPLDKDAIYRALATAGSEWLVKNLNHLPTPVPQNDTAATFTTKFDKSMSFLHPENAPAETILRQIVAYQGFPKPKYEFFGKTCIILKAHVLRVTDILCEAAGMNRATDSPLMLKCSDRNFIVIDELQPEGKKPMDARSFINGYGKNTQKPQ